MEHLKAGEQKRCIYCGQYYRPVHRTRNSQKSCKREECRAKRKKEAQKKWLESNPGYFNGRYENTKQWRKVHPEYQRQWRAKRREKRDEIQDAISSAHPVITIRLAIPANLLKGEIQDEIRLVRQCGCGFFVAGDRMQDTRRDCIIPAA